MARAWNQEDQFEDRADAGRQLAEAVAERDVGADLVLAIPRGGLPLGRAVADALGVPLDIVVASKIGAPGNPEFAIGAMASDGSAWLDEETIERFDVDEAYVDEQRVREAEYATEKAERYRGERPPPEIEGKTVVVVDDGVATGSTTIAAVRLLREQDAEGIVLAIPVGPPDTVRTLEVEADAVVCLRTPPHFGAVGQFYDRFDQVTDDEAMAYLESGAEDSS